MAVGQSQKVSKPLRNSSQSIVKLCKDSPPLAQARPAAPTRVAGQPDQGVVVHRSRVADRAVVSADWAGIPSVVGSGSLRVRRMAAAARQAARRMKQVDHRMGACWWRLDRRMEECSLPVDRRLGLVPAEAFSG